MESIFKILFFLASASSEWEDNWDILIDDNLCGYVSLLTLMSAVLLCFIFYIIIGRLTANFQKTTHWALFAFLAGISGFFIALLNVKSQIYPGIVIENFGYMFAISNIIWPIIYFVAFSFAFKYLSLYARRTPM